MKYSDYGVILRNDGLATYFLITAKGDPDGGWNDLRPMCINNSSGDVSFGGTVTASSFSGNATTSTRPLGFSSQNSTWGWGTLTSDNGYTQLTDWIYNGGEIGFAEKGGAVSCQLDGYFYQNEGNYKCLDASNIINNLTSTSTSSVLSAYQGKILNEKFNNYLPLVGGTVTGILNVGNNLRLWSDVEGGNIRITPPSGDGNVSGVSAWENDAYDGNLRWYCEKTDGSIVAPVVSIAPTGLYELGNKVITAAGGTITGGLTVSGRVYGSGDDEGIVVPKASNGYAGVCLGSTSGIRSVFYLDNSNKAFWRYCNGSSTWNIYHPGKNGTIALTTDLTDKASLTSANTYDGEQKFQNSQYCPTALDNAYAIGAAYKASRGAVNQEIVGQIIMPNTTTSDAYGCDNSANTIKFQKITDVSNGIPTLATVATMTPSSFTFNGNEVLTSGNIGSYTALGAKRLISLGKVGSSSGTHADAFKLLFTNYSSSIPKSAGVFTYMDGSYSNTSAGIGFFLSGYDSAPYGGAFVMHYNKPFYVGALAGTYTEQRIITGPANFYGTTLPSSAYEGAVYLKIT